MYRFANGSPCFWLKNTKGNRKTFFQPMFGQSVFAFYIVVLIFNFFSLNYLLIYDIVMNKL